MPSPESLTQEAPDTLNALMACLTRYRLTREANKIVAEYEGDEAVMIAALQALLKSAPDKLSVKIRQAAKESSVMNKVHFQKLRSVLGVCDVLERRDAFFALLEDHGLDPKAVLR